MLNPEQALKQAAALQAAGRLPECEAACRQLLTASPRLFQARHLLAAALDGQGRTAEALAETETVLRQQSQFAPAHLFKASLLQKLERLPEALEAFGAALALDRKR